MSTSIISLEQVFADIQKRVVLPHESSYLGFYSELIGGICTDPRAMLLPIDDHLVHRGDGVFEAFRYISGKLYLWPEHKKRIENSAAKIGLPLPKSWIQVENILQDLIQTVGANRELIFRMFISRGSGGFTTNPYESTGSRLLLIACAFKPLSEEKYKSGVSCGRSKIAQKESFWAQIKSCNYLPNVLMKKQAVDENLDFVFSFTEEGLLAESSTENVFIVSKLGELIMPPWEIILKGTTLTRVCELAKKLVADGLVQSIHQRAIMEQDLISAKEVMLAGTTLDVIAAKSYLQHQYVLGPVGIELRKLIQKDQ